MHVSITDDLKKRFHAACVLRGLKMSQVVTELLEQWLKSTEDSRSTQAWEYEYIDCLIDMNNAIADHTAIKFSIGFYDAVGALHDWQKTKSS